MTPDDRQTLLFSATLDGQIGQIAKAFTTDPSAPRARSRR